MGNGVAAKGEVVDDVQVAHDAEQRVFSAISRGKEAVWELAESLHAFDEAAGYKRLGHETLEEWLAQPEVGITRTTYYNLVGAWRKFVVNRLVTPAQIKLLDPTKVNIVADNVAKARTPLAEAISDVETLGFRDLRKKYSPPKAEPKQAPQEPEGEDDAEPVKTETKRSVREAPPEYPQEHTAVTLSVLGALARKRWHRSPTDEQVATFLASSGVALVPDLPWQILEEAAASNAPNPRIPAEVLKALLAWKSGDS